MSKKKSRNEPKDGEFPMLDQEPQTGFWSGPGFINEKVEYIVIKGRAFAEGDICLGTAEDMKKSNDIPALLEKASLEKKRAADAMTESPQAAGVILGAQYRWPNCTMPYEIDPNLPNPARVTDAMSHWNQKTGFKFVQHTTESDYVYFFDGGGCWSYVGRQGGRQELSLGGGCSTGNAIHEIGHAIGYFHEQSRNDRNNFVTINWQNIAQYAQNNFAQYLNSGQDVGNYDYCSIMHYPRDAFSINGQDTITPLQPGAECMGQRNGLSATDIAAIKTMYPDCVPPDPCLKYKIAALRCYRARNYLCYYLNIIRFFICKYRLTRKVVYLQQYRKYRDLYRFKIMPFQIKPLAQPVEEDIEEMVEPEFEEELELPLEEEFIEAELEEPMEPELEEVEPTEEFEAFEPAFQGGAICSQYRLRAGYYLRLYRKTHKMTYLCYYYRFLAAYYCCLYKYTHNKYYYYLCQLLTRKYRACMGNYP